MKRLTEEERRTLQVGGYIKAIKMYRIRTGASLKEAQSAIDVVRIDERPGLWRGFVADVYDSLQYLSPDKLLQEYTLWLDENGYLIYPKEDKCTS